MRTISTPSPQWKISDKKCRSVSIGDVKINGVKHSGSSILESPTKSEQNILTTPKNTNAINSVVTLKTEEKPKNYYFT